ncbi:MAG: ELM1/GtrOC1 family putative glycosyltransferase, partial [Pseudomonadota bacterium]|nr:ELM1/GtrOC1 family putative glycosyltransferase [Pseudomonadota bacterium]
MPGSPASPKAKPAAGQGSGRMQVWVASDGTAGMRLQALALAAAMQRARPDWTLDEFTVSPHRLIRALPRLAATVPGLPLYAASGGGTLQRRPHAGRYPDILVTCGRRMAGYALALRRRARTGGRDMKIVQIQDPRLPPAMFDALVVPRHDRARG